MKRTKLLQEIRALAKTRGLQFDEIEGANHTKIKLNGQQVTTVPRHREVNEHTAEGILKAVTEWEG